MPRFIEYISIGICSGYGDGDFRVSMEVCKLSRKSFDELRLATLTALRVAEDHWRAAQIEPECQDTAFRAMKDKPHD